MKHCAHGQIRNTPLLIPCGVPVAAITAQKDMKGHRFVYTSGYQNITVRPENKQINKKCTHTFIKESSYK